MFQAKTITTGCIGALALLVALLSPSKEVTSADSLTRFASGGLVEIQTEQSNQGLLALLLVATVSSVVWTLTGNDDADAPRMVAASVPARPAAVSRPAHQPVVPAGAQPPVAGETLADFWNQDVELAQLAEQFDLKTRLHLFKAALIAHEGGWILRLLRWPVLLVIGRPGSAKSSFAAALGITREVLNSDIKLTVVTDPNAHLKLSKGVWQSTWKLKGSRDNWGEIGSAISDMYRRFADSTAANNVSSIYDEVTTYKGNVNADQLGGFLSQVTSKARACAEFITIVAHNDTLKALGGETGEAKLKDDMAQLNLGSKATAVGEMVPTGKGAIEGLDVDEKNNPVSQPISLPRWFDPEILSALFPELYLKTEGANEDLRGTYQIPNEPLPAEAVSDSLAPRKSPVSDSANGVSALAVRIAAARDIQGHIDADLGVEVDLPAILLAFEAISEGKSDTHIIENILALKGRHHSKGKAALELIKQTFIPED